MSSIENLIRALRYYQSVSEIGYSEKFAVNEVCRDAAETIEYLSEKLQAANEELERWHTDHINEKIKNPFAQTSTLICHNCDHKDEYIEELEAEVEELKAVNMERPAEDCGGWITDRVPTKEECGDNPFGKEFAVTIDSNRIETMVMEFVYETVRGKEVTRWKWKDRISPWRVIAWHELPEPYQGAKAIDRTCRNHGSCRRCKGNRMHKNDKRELKCEQELKEYDAIRSIGNCTRRIV